MIRSASIALALLASIAAAAPPFDLPSPTGPHAVGTSSWRLTDLSRLETLGDAASANRQVEVFAWYPAASASGEPAPYLREGRSEPARFASLLGGQPDAFERLADVRTHARVDAPVVSTPQKLPLLVFSHGYGSLASAHTALLEDLASHGYIVLSIVHPYEVIAATLDDGRVVSFLDDAGKPRQAYRDVVGEWRLEDETMAKVTREAGEEEQRRLLREYLSGLPKTHAALRRWVDDTKLVLDRFLAPARDGAAAPLAARADGSRVGVLGHSMGGVTAGEFCVTDARCRAGLNLDGIPQYGSMIDKPLSRPFLMVYSARPGRLGASDAIYRRAASPYYRVDVRDTLHLDFSDMILWGGPLRDRNILGTLAPERATEMTRAIVRQYFDQVLLGRRSPLLAGERSFAEVSVTAPEKK